VVRAELLPGDEGCHEGRLVLADGTSIAITANGNVDEAEKERFVHAVNAALRQ